MPPFRMDITDMERHRVEFRLACEKAKRRFTQAKMLEVYEKILNDQLKSTNASDEQQQQVAKDNHIEVSQINPEEADRLAVFVIRLIDRCRDASQRELIQEALRRALVHARKEQQANGAPIDPMCLFCMGHFATNSQPQTPPVYQYIGGPGLVDAQQDQDNDAAAAGTNFMDEDPTEILGHMNGHTAGSYKPGQEATRDSHLAKEDSMHEWFTRDNNQVNGAGAGAGAAAGVADDDDSMPRASTPLETFIAAQNEALNASDDNPAESGPNQTETTSAADEAEFIRQATARINLWNYEQQQQQQAIDEEKKIAQNFILSRSSMNIELAKAAATTKTSANLNGGCHLADPAGLPVASQPAATVVSSLISKQVEGAIRKARESSLSQPGDLQSTSRRSSNSKQFIKHRKKGKWKSTHLE